MGPMPLLTLFVLRTRILNVWRAKLCAQVQSTTTLAAHGLDIVWTCSTCTQRTMMETHAQICAIPTAIGPMVILGVPTHLIMDVIIQEVTVCQSPQRIAMQHVQLHARKEKCCIQEVKIQWGAQCQITAGHHGVTALPFVTHLPA